MAGFAATGFVLLGLIFSLLLPKPKARSRLVADSISSTPGLGEAPPSDA
jgi:hypothetical protein